MADPGKAGDLSAWRRGPRVLDGASCAFTKKSQQEKRQISSLECMHGAKLSDHQEKGGTWSGYWEMREAKLSTQAVDKKLYAGLADQLIQKENLVRGTPSTGSSVASLFDGCALYFNGRVDGNGFNLSCFELGKLARLHGAKLSPRFTVGGVTHVICTQLSGSKEQKALLSVANRGARTPYYVLPSWITESVAAGMRLRETRFSLLASLHPLGQVMLGTNSTSSSSHLAQRSNPATSSPHMLHAAMTTTDSGSSGRDDTRNASMSLQNGYVVEVDARCPHLPKGFQRAVPVPSLAKNMDLSHHHMTVFSATEPNSDKSLGHVVVIKATANAGLSSKTANKDGLSLEVAQAVDAATICQHTRSHPSKKADAAVKDASSTGVEDAMDFPADVKSPDLVGVVQNKRNGGAMTIMPSAAFNGLNSEAASGRGLSAQDVRGVNVNGKNECMYLHPMERAGEVLNIASSPEDDIQHYAVSEPSPPCKRCRLVWPGRPWKRAVLKSSHDGAPCKIEVDPLTESDDVASTEVDDSSDNGCD